MQVYSQPHLVKLLAGGCCCFYPSLVYWQVDSVVEREEQLEASAMRRSTKWGFVLAGLHFGSLLQDVEGRGKDHVGPLQLNFAASPRTGRRRPSSQLCCVLLSTGSSILLLLDMLRSTAELNNNIRLHEMDCMCTRVWTARASLEGWGCTWQWGGVAMDDYAQGGQTSTLRATTDGERAQVLVSRLKVTLYSRCVSHHAPSL